MFSNAHTRRARVITVLILMLTAAGAVAVASAPHAVSTWAASPPAVNGTLANWPGMFTILGNSPVSVAFQNDGEFLYVALIASDPGMRMQLSLAGFSVYWDPTGGEKKTVGLTIPPTSSFRGRASRESGGAPSGGGTEERPPAGRSGSQGDPLDPSTARRGFGATPPEPITYVEARGPGKDDRHRYELTYAKTIGIEAASGMPEGMLVYEVKIPLATGPTYPFAVGSGAGKTIGVRIETGDMPRPQRSAEGEGGGSRGGGGGTGGGGYGGRGGGMGGGGYGGRGGMGGSHGTPAGVPEVKPVKVWTVVRLAAPPA